MSVYAPYNFVPLSKWIFKPNWAKQVSHDVPFSDGICGHFTLEITAKTPILVGGKQQASSEHAPGEVHFFRLPDGTYAIPGSTIKGMIRNVLEIASFSKMRQVDDQWLSVRDLRGTFYTQHLSKPLGGNRYRPLAKAGWLQLASSTNGKLEWQIIPCDFARVEQQDLISWGESQGISQANSITDKQSAIKKYQNWGNHLHLRFDLESSTLWKHQRGRITLEYQKAQPTLGKGNNEGKLVFTGQPNQNDGKPGRKHMEFIFYNDSASVKKVDENVMRGFQHIHADTDEWKYWSNKVRSGTKVPVFYLETGNKISSLGLAMMYRLAYKNSIGEMIEHTNPEHRSSDFHDFAELLFGAVNDENTKLSLKSRVNFGMGYLQNNVKERRDLPTTILSNPKASYYPAYVQQKQSPKLARDNSYKTYMDNDAEISGWKRYPINPRWEIQPLPKDLKAKNTVKVNLYPLDAGARFQCCLNIHNLRPAELGALIWGLTWGGNSELRHNLGMGRSFGLGQVSIEIKAEHLRSTNPQVTVPDRESCLKAFVKMMEKAWLEATQGKGSWAESEQLTQLLAMANPQNAPGEVEELAYLPTPKAFQDEKKEGWVLPPYHKYEGLKDYKLFPRLTKDERELEKLRQEEKQRKLRQEVEEKKAAEARAQKFSSEIEVELDEALSNAPNQSEKEKIAAEWITKMEQHDRKEEQLKLANMLKEFYDKIGKWKKPNKKKQKPKVDRIKKVLGES